MAKTPAKPKIPPLVDSPVAPEIFVSEVVGAGIVGGCVGVNLASHRWNMPESGSEPVISRVIVGRLVLSADAAVQLAQHLARLAEQGRKAQERAASGQGDKARK